MTRKKVGRALDVAKIKPKVLDWLAQGKSLSILCALQAMPDRSTIQRWQNADPEWDAEVSEARELGFHIRGEQAVQDAKTCVDAKKGRLAFDAERWYLGKLSNAFSDNKVQRREVALGMSDEAKAWLGLS